VATASGSGDLRTAASGDPSEGVRFALDGFDVADGRLVVTGRWFGVTGRRFVRPVLQVHGQRRLIAVLDHKPWTADEGARWLAAFPFDGPVGPSRLQVAPDVAVELPAAGPEAGDGSPRPARLARAPFGDRAPEAATPPVTESRIGPATASLDVEAIEQERDRARAEADRLRVDLDQARREAEDLSTELDHARADADRLRTELSHVRAESNALKPAHDTLEAEVERMRSDARRAHAERNAAQAEAERLRRTPPRQPYVAPRQIAFHDARRRADWRLRAVAVAGVAALLAVLAQLLFGVV
jgi:hypothetical protein